MDKAALMKSFNAIVSNASGTVMSERCKLCAVPLVGLKKMDMREAYVRSQQLNSEICYEGRVMYAKICNSTPFRNNRMVLCLVEQEDDEGAAFLHIFNAITSRQEEGELRFPTDARVAIKEPLCFASIMQVSSPASVEFLGLTKQARLKSVEALVTEGNMLLAKRNLVLADLYYTEAINKVATREQNTYGAVEKEAFSNRAEARLLLGRHEEAFADTEMALKISDSIHHGTSMWRKGRALTALQEHKLALPCYEENKGTKNDELQRSKMFLRQSQDGEYDLSEYLLRGLDAKYAPACSDYFGPLEMRLTPDRRGRGYYLTRDVKPGELLLVCNPVVLGKSTDAEDSEDESVELVNTCIASDRRLRQIYALAYLPEMESVSDLTAFKCNTGRVISKRENREVDVNRIRRVRGRNGFTNKVGEVTIPGLWTSLGLINHSCLPNVSRVAVGQVMFVRAMKHLRAGEEIVFSYTVEGLMSSLSKRDKKMEYLGFKCTCKRCILERENRQLLSNVGYDQDASVFDLEKNMQKWALEIENKVGMGSFTAQERDWIRAGYMDLYTAACMLKNPKLPSARDCLRIMHEVAGGSITVFAKMAFLYNIFRLGPECLDVLHEQFVVLFGKQPQKAFDAAVNKYKAHGFRL